MMLPGIEARFSGEHPKFARSNLEWLREHTGRLPDALRRGVESRWLNTEKRHGLAEANRQLLAITGKISPAGLAMAADDEAICSRAKDFADKAAKLAAACQRESVADQLDIVGGIATRAGIELPEAETEAGMINRLCCERWWRRSLRNSHKRWIEAAAISFGAVRKGRSAYVSADCLAARAGQRRRNDNALAALVAECVETGEAVPLADAVKSSVSNPAIRRNEMMLRMHGMQEFARENGYVCRFWTVTCPSRMHATKTNRKTRAIFDNPKYDGTTPRGAQAYFCNVWSKVRAELNQHGLTVFGVRVAEPHHDGTPHWHALIFSSAEDMSAVELIMRRYSLADSAGEWGNDESVRFKSKKIEWKTDAAGKVVKSPVSYVAKYIAKNLETADIDALDGERCDQAELTLADALRRVDAWRSCWGIRQFQFFGTHAVTVWRELRRIKDGPENKELMPLWETVHKTEEKGADWAGFMREMDKLPALRLAAEIPAEPNAYGEQGAPVIIGLVFTDTGLFEQTRFKRWSIKQNASFAPWSPFNNCKSGLKKKGGSSPPGNAERVKT